MLDCSRRGDSRPDHQLLRESFGSLDARRLARRAEDWEPARVKEIGDSRLQWNFGSHDSQIDLLFLGEVRQVLEPVDTDRDASRDGGDSRISRSGDQLHVRVIAAQLPGKSMLPAATTDDQHLHANAWPRSAMRSPMSSTPHESRSRSSLNPSAARRSGGTDAWVMDAGWLIRLSTPPSDSASEKTRTLLRTLAALS